MSSETEIRPFQVDMPDEVITDLRRRVAATCWPGQELVADGSQGVQLAAKSVSSCGCGGTSDSTDARSAWPSAGQGTAVVAGLPLAAKFAQAAHMLAASACWAALSVPGTGASGRSNRYCSSDPCVATGGPTRGGVKRSGAASSLNS